MEFLRRSLYFKTIVIPLFIILAGTGFFLYFLVDIRGLKILALILIYLFFFLLIVYSLFLWVFVLRPLHRLTRVMEIAKSGDFLIRSDISSPDEFGELSDSFNHMLSRLTDLMATDIEREREVITIREELKYKKLLEKRSRQVERANKELELRLKEITLLYDTISSMTSTLNLNELLKNIVRKVGETLGFKEFAILLYDNTAKKLRVVACYGLPEQEFLGMEFEPGEGIVGRVFQTGEPVLIPDTEADPNYLHWKGKKVEKGSFLSIPVKYKEEILGVFAFNSPEIDGFSRRDIKLLTALANQSAIVIENARLYEKTKEFSIRDDLTGLFNRRWFNQRIVEEFKRAERFNNPLSLLMVDIDFFKHYNDTHGHSKGDIALKEVAEVLIKNVREVDSVVRYGGEEFVILLPRTGMEDAGKIAEKLRLKMEEHEFPFGSAQPNGRFTVSIGYTTYPDIARSISDLFTQADEALYTAKRMGRNRVVRYSSSID